MNLIEADFVQKRMGCEDIHKKYGLAMSTIFYHSKKKDWMKKRKLFTKRVREKVNEKSIKVGVNKAVKDEMTLIERFEKLLKLKLNAELEVFFDRVGVKTKKDLMYLVNKSKDSTTEIAKLLELLKGNATDRTEVTTKEKTVRYDRLKEFMTSG